MHYSRANRVQKFISPVPVEDARDHIQELEAITPQSGQSAPSISVDLEQIRQRIYHFKVYYQAEDIIRITVAEGFLQPWNQDVTLVTLMPIVSQFHYPHFVLPGAMLIGTGLCVVGATERWAAYIFFLFILCLFWIGLIYATVTLFVPDSRQELETLLNRQLHRDQSVTLDDPRTYFDESAFTTPPGTEPPDTPT